MPTKKSTKAKKLNPWMIITIALLLVFSFFIAYDKSPTIHNGINNALGVDDDKFPVIPELKVDIFTDKSSDGPSIDIEKQLEQIEDEFMLKIKLNEIDTNTEEGKAKAAEFNLKTVPVLAFNEDVKDTGFYADAKDFLEKENDKYLLRLTPTSYLQLPGKELGHSKGTPGAPITIIEYSSFSCPYCGKMMEPLYRLLDEYPGQIELIYKQYNRGGIDPVLENAAECAAEQGKFWEFHDYIFDNQSTLATVEPDQFLTTAATTAGLNLDEYNKCNEEMRYEKVIRDQTAEGFDFGVTGTPSFFINDQFIGGAVGYDTLKSTVDSLLN